MVYLYTSSYAVLTIADLHSYTMDQMKDAIIPINAVLNRFCHVIPMDRLNTLCVVVPIRAEVYRIFLYLFTQVINLLYLLSQTL